MRMRSDHVVEWKKISQGLVSFFWGLLILGVVDTVLALANAGASPQAGSSPGPGHSSRPLPPCSQSQPGPSSQQLPCSSSIVSRCQLSKQVSNCSSAEEHRRLLNYKPSLKGKRPISAQKRGQRKASLTWRKDCICLRDKEQSWKPSSEEKIALASMELGLKEVVFMSDGDAEHIHRMILDTFLVLEECGGYSLLCVAENSHSMVLI